MLMIMIPLILLLEDHQELQVKKKALILLIIGVSVFLVFAPVTIHLSSDCGSSTGPGGATPCSVIVRYQSITRYFSGVGGEFFNTRYFLCWQNMCSEIL